MNKDKETTEEFAAWCHDVEEYAKAHPQRPTYYGSDDFDDSVFETDPNEPVDEFGCEAAARDMVWPKGF